MKIRIGIRKDLSFMKSLEDLPDAFGMDKMPDGYPFFISIGTPVGYLEFYRVKSTGKIPYYELRHKKSKIHYI